MMPRWMLALQSDVHVRWVVADQVLVSASNFAMGVLFARFLGPAAFGVYALVLTAQQYFTYLSASIIAGPMVMTAPHTRSEEANRKIICAGHAAQIVLSSILAVATLIGTTAWIQWDPGRIQPPLALAIAAAAFTLPLREWYRHLGVLRREGPRVFLIDLATFPPMIIAAFALHSHDYLSTESAIALWALGGALGCTTGVFTLGVPLVLNAFREFAREHWRIAKDTVFAYQMQWLGGQGVQYLCAPILGATGIGAFRSTASLLAFTNVLSQSMDYTVAVRSSRVFAENGREALDQYLRRLGRQVMGGLVLLLVAFLVAPETLIVAVLGSAYRPFAWVLRLHVASTVLSFLYRILIYRHRAMLQTDLVAKSTSIIAFSSIIATPTFSSLFGVTGMVLGIVTAQALGILYLVKRR